MCQVWCRSVGKCMILSTNPPLAHLPQEQDFRYEITPVFISGVENTCPKFGPDPSENARFFVKSTPSPICSRGQFSILKHASIFYPRDENYICQVWSRSVGKYKILCQTSPFPHLPQGLVFRYENTPAFNTCPKLVQIRRKIHDFTSNLPLPPLVLGVGFSI